MFLRKLTVMVVPLALAWVLSLVLPLMSSWGFWSNAAKGVVLGAGLALLLPLSGATRRREPFAVLLWVPTVLLTATVVYQGLAAEGQWALPLLRVLETQSGQTVLVESTIVGFMLVQLFRTKK